MFLKPIITLLILYFQCTFGKENFTEIISLVNEFIVKENSPTKIFAYVCWSKDIKLELWKKFSKNFYFTSVGGFQRPLQHSSFGEHQMFLVDIGCKDAANILNQAQQLNLFSQPYRWLIWGHNKDPIFDDLFIGLDSRVFTIENNDLEYEIKSVYKHANNSGRFFENYITAWRYGQGFSYFNEFSAPKNRTNIMGTTVRISYVVTNNDTYNHLWDYRNKHIDSITKLNWFLVEHLMAYVNGTPVKIFQKTWGYKNATTSLYSGLIGDLQTGQAELGGTASFFTIDRIDIVDYIPPTTRTFMKFIFKAPPLTYVTNVFTLPFDSYVWYSCFVLIAIILAVAYLIVMWEWRDPVFRKKVLKTPSLEPNVFDVFLMEVGAITQQGTDVEPKSSAGRIVYIFTFVALMFLYTSYSANIVALLQSTTESIRTLEDLLKSRISLGVEDIVYAHYYFENAQEPIRKAIYEQKVAPKGQKSNFMSVEEGIERVQKGFFAFHVELSTGYKVVGDIFQENEKCGLKEIVYINLIEPWLAVRKKSVFKEIFKVGMQRIHETGIKMRELNRIYTKKPVCHNKGSNFDSVGMIDCYAAFLIFGIGIGCGFILLLLEISVRKYYQYKETIKVMKYDEE